MSVVVLILALSGAKLPESSTVEFSQTASGMDGSRTEVFKITQRGKSVRIAYDKWGKSRGLLRDPDTTRTHLVNTIPVDAYQELWDSLSACGFFALDSSYYGREIVTDADRDGYVAVEYSSNTRVVSKRVSFGGIGYLDEPFQRALGAVARMALWVTASVEQVRTGKIAFAVTRWTPRMLRYISESGDAPEMTRDILALVDSTTTHKGPEYRWFAKGPLLAFAKSSVGTLDSALSHPNPKVRLLVLAVATDTLGDRAVPMARRMLRDTFGDVRYNAAIFLAKRDSADAMPVLYESLRDSAFAQSTSARVLLARGTPEALDTMFSWAGYASYREVGHLVDWPGIGEMMDERVSPVLRRLFSSGVVELKSILRDVGKRPSDSVLFDTVAAFLAEDPGRFSTREFTVSALLRLSKYKDALPAMRAAFRKWPGDADIMGGLAYLHDSTYFDTFVQYATDGSAWQKDHAVRALAYFDSDLGRELKLRVLSSDSVSVYAVMAFITQPDPRAYDRLVELLQDDRSSPAMVSWLCNALCALGDRRAIPVLEKMLRKVSAYSREHTIEPALQSLREQTKR